MSIIGFIKGHLQDIVAICGRELRRVFADSASILFFFVVPFIYPFLYAALYGNEVAREAPLVVLDYSHSALSREFVRRVDASSDVAVIAQVASEAEAYQLINEEKAYGILIFPEDFSQKAHLGRQAEVNLHTTFASALYYKAFALTATEVALTMGRELEASRSYGASHEATRIQVRPIESEWITPFNPQGGFQGFLLPGVLILIIQQTLLIGISMVMGTERERGGLSRGLCIVRGGRYTSTMRLLVGRALCYLLIYAVSSLFTLVVAPRIFGLPQLTDAGTFALLLLPLLLACIFFSFFWSLVVKHREKAMIIWVFTSIPFLFLTGLSWPLSAIPAPLRALGLLIPSTPGVQAFVSISSMGASLRDVLPQYLTLWAQALGYFLIASFTYARLLRSSSTSLSQTAHATDHTQPDTPPRLP